MSEVEKMAYYDLKTNEIWAESNIDRFHDEHIEIDEVIAPLIRELNIKGYLIASLTKPLLLSTI